MPDQDQEVQDRYFGAIGASPGKELKEVPKGKYYLVAIAVSEYADSKFNLANPVFDAEMIVSILLKQYGEKDTQGEKSWGFYEDNLKWFKDKDVAKDSIISYFKKTLVPNLQPEDCLLVYYAGHGEIENDTLYLSTHDYHQDKPSQRFTCQELAQFFNEINGEPRKCRDVLFILDCCFSGAAQYGITAETSAKFSRKLLVSSSPGQKAGDGLPLLGSPFARALGEALEEESRIVFSIKDIEAAVQKKVKILTKEGQDVSYCNIGQIATGGTQFMFIRKEINVNPIALTKNIIKKELNFKEQTAFFPRAYRPSRGNGAFTIFISPGKTMNGREILSYIFLLYKFDKGKYTVPEKAYTCRSIQLINPDESVWQHLLRDKSMQKPADYFAHLVEYFEAYYLSNQYQNNSKIELYNLLLTDCASPELLKKAIEFCVDFYDSYQLFIQQLPNKQLAQYIQAQVKTIINIQEEREGSSTLVQKDWFKELFKNEINIVYELSPVSQIYIEQLEEWFELTRPEIKHPVFEALKPETFFKNTEVQDVDELICALYHQCDIKLTGTPIEHFFSIKKPPGIWQP